MTPSAPAAPPDVTPPERRPVLDTPLERRLTLRQLRIFQNVVDQGSFTRAAETLSLSQPAVTHQIQALSRAVGHSLFMPGRRPLELTAIGAALYDRARRLLAMVEETAEAIDDLAGLRAGSVTVAGDTTAGVYILPDALAAFRGERPGIALRLDVVNRAAVRELILRGDADIGVVGRLWEDDLLAAEDLVANQLMCYSAPQHPLSGRRLLPADLIDGPLLLREPGSGTRESAERILRDAGVDPVPAMEMASNGALKRAVAVGLGVTVLSTHAVGLELEAGLLRPLDVEGFPVRRMWHVVWASGRLLSPAATAFRTFLHTGGWRHSLATALGSE
ncbi:MAG: LysR family transcriptional regulator [Candidatus Dormibacteria bacterium]